jgi:manganese oxidase
MVADNPGDWAFHCHKTHHAMNAMGHNIRNFIGVEKRDLARQVRKLVPDYMPMGSAGMANMGAMEMPMPDNTLPMMTGFGQFGPIEMGGMFTLMKIARDWGPTITAIPATTSTRKARSHMKLQLHLRRHRQNGPAAEPNVGPKAIKPGSNHKGH